MHRQGEPVDYLKPVFGAAEVWPCRNAVRQVRFDGTPAGLSARHSGRDPQAPQVTLGASTRAGLALYRASQALALIENRDYVIPDDIKRLAVPVLAHRLLLKRTRQANAKDAAVAFLDEVLARLSVPM